MLEDNFYYKLVPRWPLKVGNYQLYMLKLFDTIRTLVEWQSLGLDIKLDEYQIPIRNENLSYDFRAIILLEPRYEEAILTKKKYTCIPWIVSEYIVAGCTFDDFVELDDDVKYYCHSVCFLLKGKIKESNECLEKALELKPNELHYRNKYYEAQLKAGDLSIIEKEFTYFETEIDCIVHTGRFDEWMKALINNELFDDAKSLSIRVDAALVRLIKGETAHQYYQESSIDWVEYKRTQHLKAVDKFLRKIEKLEQKKNKLKTKSP